MSDPQAPAVAGQSLAQAGPSNAHLFYYGGAVIPNVNIQLLFWNSGVAAANRTKLHDFFTDVTDSVFMDWLAEYDTPTQSIGRRLAPLPTAVVDTNGNANVTDAQVQARITTLIGNGTLPPPDGNLMYFVYFPPGIVITDSGGNKSCAAGSFCAYHGSFVTGGKVAYYAILPDFSAGGCSMGCGTGAAFDNWTMASSHEMIEAVTDAQVGQAVGEAPPLAWYDAHPLSAPLGEIGDICNQIPGNIPGPANLAPGWVVQQEWSNNAGSCIPYGAQTNTGVVPYTTPCLAGRSCAGKNCGTDGCYGSCSPAREPFGSCGACRTCTAGVCNVLANATDPAHCAGLYACDATGACKIRNGGDCTSDTLFFTAKTDTTVNPPDKYLYWVFSKPSYTLKAGDRVQYDLYLAQSLPDIGELALGIGSGVSASYALLPPDLNDVSGDPTLTDLSPQAFSAWYHRELPPIPELIGKVVTSMAIVDEHDGVSIRGDAYIDNVAIVDASGNVAALAYQSGAPTANQSLFTGTNGYLVPPNYAPNVNLSKQAGPGLPDPTRCASGFCVGGLCCSSACTGCGACNVTPGTCTPLAQGNAGSPSCAPYLCDGAGTTCPTTCTSSAGCVAGDFCCTGALPCFAVGSNQNHCLAPQANGAGCSAPGQCASGNCVGGTCCGGACGPCGTCATGACVNLPGGNPTPCGGNLVCTGSSPTCPASCSSDAGCAFGFHCATGACVAPGPSGSGTPVWTDAFAGANISPSTNWNGDAFLALGSQLIGIDYTSANGAQLAGSPFQAGGAIEHFPELVQLADGRYYAFAAADSGFLYKLDTATMAATHADLSCACATNALHGSPAIQVAQFADTNFRALGKDLVFVVSDCATTSGNQVLALDAANLGPQSGCNLAASTVWRFQPGTMSFGSEGCDIDYALDQLYCGTDQPAGGAQNTVWALSTINGALRWARNLSSPTLGGVRNRPQLSGGRVYVAAMDGSLHVLDAATGADVVPQAALGASVSNNLWVEFRGAYAGWVFAVTDDGALHILKDNGASLAVVKTFSFAPAHAIGPAAVEPSSGKAYVGMDDGSVRQIDLPTLAQDRQYAAANANLPAPANLVTEPTFLIEAGALKMIVSSAGSFGTVTKKFVVPFP